MTITMNTVKIGDRVVLANPRKTRGLKLDKVYVISGIHTLGREDAGTVSLMGEFNEEAQNHWAPGSYGYRIFKPAPEPTVLSDASIREIVAELRLRGITGSLEVPRNTTETVHV